MICEKIISRIELLLLLFKKAESPSSGDKIDMYILLFSENAFLVAVGVVEYFHCVKVVGVRGDRGLPRQLRRRLRAEKETNGPLQEDRQA